ncbi:SUF system NifU family Fe-S cluster assembly protein [Novacetimonas hansenii]|uniref:SUF system NifU family Fe-S cluster assembly protein n=1 Tax=Novacetimonas hansenii TaxID=436 RepID=A0AAW5ERP5_NOVHA|nr:SUF system NifU family Fe-S cluster assembly protein [Novacetimonas hansenii]MBL7235370.1 SUF system NifU family Fe-S cluster assembly protein [Novacetimonas hansenii]MCJ8353563.1 SUF system NifU family Fe-S cluster assembly protein [Novacetimonas hansenii]QOF96136.1 SUF system NifU family Fe-S cluster assembly protein [Novacetimonas hansenii]
MTQEDLYRRLVVERARTPMFGGEVEDAQMRGEGTNPLCGDRVRLTASMTPGGRIAAVRHETRGCAICAASADLMAEHVTGHDPAWVAELGAVFEAMLKTGHPVEAAGDLAVFAPLHQYRSRIRCATLPWTALTAMLNDLKDR